MNQRPAASGDRRPPRRPRRAQLDPARRAAFDVLRAVSERDAYANLALPALLAERGINGRDAAFATELTYGACRTRGLLDAVIAAAAGAVSALTSLSSPSSPSSSGAEAQPRERTQLRDDPSYLRRGGRTRSTALTSASCRGGAASAWE